MKAPHISRGGGAVYSEGRMVCNGATSYMRVKGRLSRDGEALDEDSCVSSTRDRCHVTPAAGHFPGANYCLLVDGVYSTAAPPNDFQGVDHKQVCRRL